MRASLEKRKVNAEKGLLEECIEADLNFHIAIADAAHNRYRKAHSSIGQHSDLSAEKHDTQRNHFHSDS